MRRWKITAILAVVAAVAAFLAPYGYKRMPGVEMVTTPIANQMPQQTRQQGTIPEVGRGVHIPAKRQVTRPPPTPVPETFWHDAVDCGMG